MLAVSLLLLLLAGHLVLRWRRSFARRRGTVRRLSESLAASRALTRPPSTLAGHPSAYSRSMPRAGAATSVRRDGRLYSMRTRTSAWRSRYGSGQAERGVPGAAGHE